MTTILSDEAVLNRETLKFWRLIIGALSTTYLTKPQGISVRENKGSCCFCFMFMVCMVP